MSSVVGLCVLIAPMNPLFANPQALQEGTAEWCFVLMWQCQMQLRSAVF